MGLTGFMVNRHDLCKVDHGEPGQPEYCHIHLYIIAGLYPAIMASRMQPVP